MIGIDTNILVDLLVSSTPQHNQVVQAVSKLDEDFCTTPTNIGECLRVITHPKVFLKPLVLSRAVLLLSQALDFYKIRILEESTDWWQALTEVEKDIPGIRGNEIFDARIALCLKFHGVKRIYSRDADFRKYSFIKILTL